MSLSAAVINALLGAGATREQLAAAMIADVAEREAIEAAKLEKKRAGNRERQARKRASNASSRVTAVTTRDERDTPPSGSPKDINQTPSSPPETSEPDGSSSLPRAWSLPPGVSFQVWEDLKKNRSRKRLPNTETAWKTFCDDLKRVSSQTGIPPPKLIELCAGRGWASIKDPRESNYGQRPRDQVGKSAAAFRLATANLHPDEPF